MWLKARFGGSTDFYRVSLNIIKPHRLFSMIKITYVVQTDKDTSYVMFIYNDILEMFSNMLLIYNDILEMFSLAFPMHRNRYCFHCSVPAHSNPSVMNSHVY